MTDREVREVSRESLELSRRELGQGAAVAATGAAAMALASNAAAQTSTEISGTVTDSSGGVQGATVVAVPHDSSLDPLVTTTDSSGAYQFAQSDLYSGTNLYHVIARAGTESNPRRAQENYPFIAAEGGTAVPADVIYRWKLDEGSGTTINDSVDGLNGTLNGGTWTPNQNSVGGYHLDFDGTDDYISYGQVQNEPQTTVAFWANFDTVPSGTATDWVFYWSLNGGNDTGFAVSLEQSSIRLSVGSSDVVSSYTPPTGSWIHIAASYDSGGVLSLYIDGNLEQQWTVGDGSIANGTRDLNVMKESYGGGIYADGSLDDIHVADTDLSLSEINDIRNLSPRA